MLKFEGDRMTTSQQIEQAGARQRELKTALLEVDRRLWGLEEQAKADAEGSGRAALNQVLKRTDGAEFKDMAQRAGERAALADGLRKARKSLEAQFAAEAKLIECLNEQARAEQAVAAIDQITRAGACLAEALAVAAAAGESLRASGAGREFFEEAITTSGLGLLLGKVEIKIAVRAVPSRIIETPFTDARGETKISRGVETPPRRDAATLAADVLVEPLQSRLMTAHQAVKGALRDVRQLQEACAPADRELTSVI